MNKKTKVFVLGDIHGVFEVIKYSINRLNIKDSIIIQVGDFGLGFGDKKIEISKLNKINSALKLTNNILVAIRGNHDNPSRFNGEYTDKFSNIVFLPDYSTMEINNKKFLFVGGAISIDRKRRTEGKSFWSDEKFIIDEKLIDDSIPNTIDYLITHTTSLEVLEAMEDEGVLTKDIVNMFAITDSNLIPELYEENVLVSELIKRLPNIKEHYFGHFHKSYSKKINKVKHTLLDINEIKEIKM